MGADVLKQLVPFGITGLAIIAVVLIATNWRSSAKRALAVIPMVLIVALAIFDKLYSTPTLEPALQPPHVRPELVHEEVYWVETGTIRDWGGRNIAYTGGLISNQPVRHNASSPSTIRSTAVRLGSVRAARALLDGDAATSEFTG